MMGKSEDDRRSWLSRVAYAALIGALACNAGALAGCSGSSGGGGGGEEPDAGDAGDGGHVSDGGGDAGHDGGVDAGDSGSDGGVDSGTDSGEDAGVDSGEDSGHDAGDASDGSVIVVDAGDAGHDAGDSGNGGGGDAGDAGDAGHDGGVDAGDGGDAGAPVASFATTPIDLGLGDCGGAAATGTLTITNSGGSLLTVGASFGASTGFSVTSNVPAGGLAANASGTLTISATVPQNATAAQAIVGTLTITTNDSSHASTAVTVSVTPHGATLAFTGTPTTAAFGTVQANVAATPIALTLTNTGNAPATGVAIAAPSDGEFSFTATPTLPAAIAAGGTEAISAAFTPANASGTQATSSGAITFTGAACGTSVGSLSFSGAGATGAVTGWPSAQVDFGPGNCGGAAPAAKSFTLTNAGGVPVHITAITPGGVSGYTTTLTTTSVIPANGTLPVTITPPAVPTPSAVPGNYAATLTVTTDEQGDTPHVISLTEEANGAILSLDTTTVTLQSVAAFGSTSGGFTVTNNGTTQPTVTLTSAVTTQGVTTSPFTTTPASFPLSTPQAVTETFAPTSFGTVSQTVTLGVGATDVLCAPLPGPVTVTGTGEEGGIQFNQTAFAFSANCNSTAAPQDLTIKNNGNVAITWTATLLTPGGTPYVLTTTLGDAQAANGNANTDLEPGITDTVHITPALIPQFPTSVSPQAFAGEIDITTNIPNDQPHHVFLTETPLGDVLTVTPVTSEEEPQLIPFQPVGINSPTASSFRIANSGNTGTAVVQFASTSNDGDGVFPVQGQTGIAAGATVAVPIGFDTPEVQPESGTIEGSISFSTNDAICAPLPPDFFVEGQVTAAGPSFSATSLAFTNNVADNAGLVDCGNTAAPQTFTIVNTNTLDFSINSLQVIKGLDPNGTTTSPYFTVTTTGTVVQANQANSVTVTVTPSAVAPTNAEPNGIVPDFDEYSGILMVTMSDTSGVAIPTEPITLNMGAQGVIVTAAPLPLNPWNFPSTSVSESFQNPNDPEGPPIVIPSMESIQFSIGNSGNWPLQVALTGFPSGDFSLENNQGVNNENVVVEGSLETTPDFLQLDPTFTAPTFAVQVTDTGNLVVTPVGGGSFCEPLPAAWSATFTATGTATANNPPPF